MTYILVKSVSTVVTTTVLDSTICVYTSVVPVNMLHWDVTTGADAWRDEAFNRYQQQQQVIEAETVITFKNRLRHPYIYKFKWVQTVQVSKKVD